MQYKQQIHYSVTSSSLSLIKMMYWISKNTGKCLTMNQLQHCLKRNFGGKLDVDETVERFLKNIPTNLLVSLVSEQRGSDIEVCIIIEILLI